MMKVCSAFVALWFCAGVAFAQSPAVNAKEAEYAKQQQQRQAQTRNQTPPPALGLIFTRARPDAR